MNTLFDFLDAHSPDCWLLGFLGLGEVVLEYFPSGCIGDKESGAGIWEASGPIDEVLKKAMEFYQYETNK